MESESSAGLAYVIDSDGRSATSIMPRVIPPQYMTLPSALGLLRSML
jgi:hypothetical protein